LSLLISKSDIVIEVLDARDPFSYRSKELENNVLHNKDKKFVLILNKIDLVSKKNYETWASIFRKDLPTVLFSSKSEIFENSFKELTNLLKNLAGDKKATVCFVGYPNTGKNTIIQKIKEKKQSRKSQNLDTDEIILENNIFLYEKTGAVYSKNETGALMPKCFKSVDELKTPITVLANLLNNVDKDTLLELYEIAEFDNVNEFLDNIAKKNHFLMKKGYVDTERAARFIINDIIEGKIKYESNIEDQ